MTRFNLSKVISYWPAAALTLILGTALLHVYGLQHSEKAKDFLESTLQLKDVRILGKAKLEDCSGGLYRDEFTAKTYNGKKITGCVSETAIGRQSLTPYN